MTSDSLSQNKEISIIRVPWFITLNSEKEGSGVRMESV